MLQKPLCSQVKVLVTPQHLLFIFNMLLSCSPCSAPDYSDNGFRRVDWQKSYWQLTSHIFLSLYLLFFTFTQQSNWRINMPNILLGLGNVMNCYFWLKWQVTIKWKISSITFLPCNISNLTADLCSFLPNENPWTPKVSFFNLRVITILWWFLPYINVNRP